MGEVGLSSVSIAGVPLDPEGRGLFGLHSRGPPLLPHPHYSRRLRRMGEGVSIAGAQKDGPLLVCLFHIRLDILFEKSSVLVGVCTNIYVIR